MSAAAGREAASLIWEETSENAKCQMSNLKTQTNPNTQIPKLQTPMHVVFGICGLDIWCLFVICHLSFVISLMSQYIKHLGLQEPEAA